MDKVKKILIAGAGPVGSLLAIYLIRRGYEITLVERRPDLRKSQLDGGRSINLALSNRGLKPLRELKLEGLVEEMIIPMKGRMIHDLEGNTTLQPYGKEGQVINSISRAGLNQLLIQVAEREECNLIFDCKVNRVDLDKNIVFAEKDGKLMEFTPDLIIGSDGAFSVMRSSFQITDRFDYNQFYIEHGYKELTIPANQDGSFRMANNALHIWPRGRFMLIALPNMDGSFTCTLFLPFEGEISFRSLDNYNKVEEFFVQTFPDAFKYLTNLEEDFVNNPTSSLVTIRCFPWVRNKTLLIGDAAHAVVPFYGQGMNCGFEDCQVLNSLLEKYEDDWIQVLDEFQNSRKPDADAISELALRNFIEMRDLVANEKFILQKKIEAKLHFMFPDRWIPLYSMVTFNESMRYSEALRLGDRQQKIMNEIMKTPGLDKSWESLNFDEIVKKLEGDF